MMKWLQRLINGREMDILSDLDSQQRQLDDIRRAVTRLDAIVDGIITGTKRTKDWPDMAQAAAAAESDFRIRYQHLGAEVAGDD